MSFLRRITSKPDIATTSTSNSTYSSPNSAAIPTPTANTETTASPRTVVEGSCDTLDTLDGDNAPSTSGQRRRSTPLGADSATPVSTCAFRVRRELNEIRKNPPPNCSADLCMDRLLHWTATVIGPAGSVYEGGHFKLDIRFPLNYPFRPPRIRFTTFIYHCNVDSVGVICLDVLNERWSPVMNVAKVLLSIWLLLGECNPEDPLVMCIADQYKTNRLEHDRVARFWTKRFAMPKEAQESKDSKNTKDPNEPKEFAKQKDTDKQNNPGEPM
ncbi:ubiquitin-conjugating enzyme E2 E1 [Drosophila obscura]|uniref:ubiquitin-conjugating enzyme E2 E1 n=1 Tax=Drosophila obscura TaxID=7282 RepID=UPI000B9FAD0F|nr:ubiquitin-conjugating enzyme E2 E1 [Drosophila obscura]